MRKIEDVASSEQLPADANKLPVRMFVVAGIVGFAMIPVGVFLAGLGILVLRISGGAATDTSVVVAVAAFLITDFWGGGIMAAATRQPTNRIVICWTAMRFVLLFVLVILLPKALYVAPVLLLLGAPAAHFGARMSHKQAAMRRELPS